MISALAWVRRGVAKAEPERQQFDSEEYDRIQGLVKSEVENAQGAYNEAKDQGSNSDTSDQAMDEDTVESTAEPVDPELAEYNLENYDDDEDEDSDDDDKPDTKASGQGLSFFSNINTLISQDAIENDDMMEASDEEDIRIRPTDNLLVTARTENDISHLEVYVYESQESHLYIHHDVMLPAFPLCVEWLDFRMGPNNPDTSLPGNYIAVGTFDPVIEIWNLDTLEGMYPDAMLGKPTLKGKGGKKKSKKSATGPDMTIGQNDQHHDAVLALSWNKNHRNLLLSASADRSIKLWDLKTATCAHSYHHHQDKVQAVEWHPVESTMFVSGGFDRALTILDSRSPASLTGCRVASDIECVRWDPHAPQCFYVTTEDGMVQYMDVRKLSLTSSIASLPAATPLFKIQAHDSAVSAFDINPLVKGCLVTASVDQTVKIWNVNDTNQPRHVLSRNLNVGQVFSVVFCPDSPFLIAAAGSKGNVTVWNAYANRGVRVSFEGRPIVGQQGAPSVELKANSDKDGDDLVEAFDDDCSDSEHEIENENTMATDDEDD
ncbi:rRNA-processing protein [Dispira simplex]|nr:rRNA-processing protein [Dispira simplex]